MKEKLSSLSEQEKEQWKDIEDYVQSFTALGKTYSRPLYRISSYGRIMSDTGSGYKEMTPQVNNFNQKVIMLAGKDSSGKATTEMVGLLVARHFVPNPNGYSFIDFIDGNPQNCRAENIKWVALTRKQKNMYKQMEKKINRYSFEGKFIESFNSITDASKELFERKEANSVKGASSGLSLACRTHRSFVGSQWRFDSECSEDTMIDPYREEKTIYICLDKKTKEKLYEFDGMEEAARFLGKTVGVIQANISNCCAGKRPTAYGYSWSLKRVDKLKDGS